jgi:hypothetical protein
VQQLYFFAIAGVTPALAVVAVFPPLAGQMSPTTVAQAMSASFHLNYYRW